MKRLPPLRLSATVLAATVLAVLVFLPSEVGAQRAGFEDETTVMVVEVPVNVHVDGGAVRGLTRDDFVIKEGRREWPLVGFEVVDLAAGTATRRAEEVTEPEPVPIAARRHFLLLFDLILAV